MSGDYVGGALVFLIDTLLRLYTGVVLLRLLLQWVRADFYNPVSQAIVKLTNPLLRPLRRVVPALGRIDTASVVLALGVQAVNVVARVLLAGGAPGAGGVAVLAVSACLDVLLGLWMLALLALFIASWVAPYQRNPALALLDAISEPLLRPIRNVLPPLGGLDFSMMVALLALKLVEMLVVAPMNAAGLALL